MDTIEEQTAAVVAARRGRKPKAEVEADFAPIAAAASEEHEQPVAKSKESAKRLFPVKMIRNYRPINPFTIDGVKPTPEQEQKVPAGACIEMDIDEAKDVIAKGIAVRNDPIG